LANSYLLTNFYQELIDKLETMNKSMKMFAFAND